MDNLNLPTWVGKAIYALGIAAILGGSSTVLSNTKDVAVLKAQQSNVEHTLDRIESKLDRVIEGHDHDTSK